MFLKKQKNGVIVESSPRKPWQENLSEEVVEKAESIYEEMISQTERVGPELAMVFVPCLRVVKICRK